MTPEPVEAQVERVREVLELVYREHFAAADDALAALTELAERVKAAERERDELKKALQDEQDNWNPEARPTITAQRDELVEAGNLLMDLWAQEFADDGHPEDGDVPRWQTYPYSKLRDALAKVRGEAE